MNNPPITGFPELDSYLFNLSLGLPDINTNSLSIRSDNAIVDYNNNVISYINQYMHIKYADDNIGTNISNSPTNKAYFGLFNSITGTESTAPADYTWYLVSGGFGTTNYLWYIVPGGRRFSYYIGPSAPSYLYSVDAGTAVNLDIISSADGSSARICYAKSSSSSLASTPTSVTVAGNTTYPTTNTWGGSEVWVATAPALSTNEYLYQSDGVYNPTTGFTTWNVPYLSNLKVGSLSAITANMGTLTAGEIIVGSSPAVSGNTMTGSGTRLYGDGKFVMGNSTTNITFNGTNAYINGFSISANSSSVSVNFSTSAKVALISFTLTEPATVSYIAAGTLVCQSSSASMDSIGNDVQFTLENSSSTVIENRFAGNSGRAAKFDIGRYLSSSIVYTNIKSLAAGTYTIYVQRGNITVADDTGFLIPNPYTLPTFSWYMSGVIASYQILKV